MRRALPAILMTVLTLGSPAATAQEAQTGQITVTGTGEASAAPDIATVTLGIETAAPDAATAMDAASETAERLIATMRAQEIAARDVQTSGLTLRPVFARDTEPRAAAPEISGFVAENRLSVRVRALDRLGDVLAAALDDGANRLDSLSFDIADPAPLLEQARRAAIADARLRAETYADAAGVTLGRVLSISESGARGPSPMRMEAAAARSVPVAAGETSLSASVSVVYALTP